MFHIGHLKILQKAKSECDFLVVGVSTDELVFNEKKVSLVIPYHDRCAIVESIKYVDKVVPQISYDKYAAWEDLRFNKMFVGDDWKGSDRWIELEQRFDSVGVKISYLRYTRVISSSKLRDIVESNYQKTKQL